MSSVFVEAPAASTQVLKNTQATLSVTFSSGAADAAVTTLVTNAAGTTVSTGTATHGAGGVYTYVLPPQTDVAALTVKWTGTFGGVVQSLQFAVDVVGALLFTLADLRTFGPPNDTPLTDTAKYPDQVLADSRARITDLFRRCCGVSFIPRYDHWEFDAYFQTTLYIPAKRVTKLLNVMLNGVAVDAPTLAAMVVQPSGMLYHSNTFFGFWSGWQRNQIAVEYEHGWAQPPPEITRIGMQLARYELTASQLADRFISMSNEFGVVRQAQPSMNNPTGIPVIDATLCRYSQQTPVEV
jgi:hypothetical protein